MLAVVLAMAPFMPAIYAARKRHVQHEKEKLLLAAEKADADGTCSDEWHNICSVWID